jgi:hypothetical protein
MGATAGQIGGSGPAISAACSTRGDAPAKRLKILRWGVANEDSIYSNVSDLIADHKTR